GRYPMPERIIAREILRIPALEFDCQGTRSTWELLREHLVRMVRARARQRDGRRERILNRDIARYQSEMVELAALGRLEVQVSLMQELRQERAAWVSTVLQLVERPELWEML